MNPPLTPGHERFRAQVRAFAEKRIMPVSAEMDRKMEFPSDIIAEMAGLGYMGIPIPAELGGKGMDFLSYILAVEELSRASASVGVIMAVHTSVGTMPILVNGTPEQKKRFIPDLASGRKLGAFAITEANAGSDASAMTARAEPDGDGWRLSGAKIFITNAAMCDVIVVVARTDSGLGHRGLCAFLVEKGMPGFTVGAREKTMGMKGSITSEVLFENVQIPAQNVLGKPGEGFKVAMSTLDGGRIGIGAQAAGIAQAALEEGIRWARSGSPPRFNDQSVQMALAEIEARVQASRALVYNAAMAKDMGRPLGKDASIAKLFATETATWATQRVSRMVGMEALLHGSAIERLTREAKVTEIYEGTSEIQKMVIAKRLVE